MMLWTGFINEISMMLWTGFIIEISVMLWTGYMKNLITAFKYKWIKCVKVGDHNTYELLLWKLFDVKPNL